MRARVLEVVALPERQEIGEDEQLLRLLVAFVAEAERHELAAFERRPLAEVVFEPSRADAAEVLPDRTAEDADDVLPVVPPGEGIVVARRKSEVVGGDGGTGAGRPQRRRQIEGNAGAMRDAEIRMQANGGAPEQSEAAYSGGRVTPRVVSETRRVDSATGTIGSRTSSLMRPSTERAYLAGAGLVSTKRAP